MFWQSESRAVHRHGRDENRHLKMADALTKARHRRRAPDADHSAQERAFKALERVEERQRQHERNAAIRKRSAPAHRRQQRASIDPRIRAGKGGAPAKAQTSKLGHGGRGAHWPCWHLSSCRASSSGCSNDSAIPHRPTQKSAPGQQRLPLPLVMLYEGTVLQTTAIPSAS